MRVLFVCHGNTCRSPMAEVILADLASREPGLEHLRVESAGLDAGDGERASKGAVQAMVARRLDLGGHESRRLGPDVLAGVDLVLAMTTAYRKAVEKKFRGLEARVFTLGEYAGAAGANVDVSDPIGGSADVYRACAARIEDLLRRALPRLVEEAR